MQPPADNPTPTVEGSRRLDLRSRLLLAVATGLGAGYAPLVPGTCGALWGLPLTWLVMRFPYPWPQALVVAVLVAVGVPLCGVASRMLGGHDPAAVVYDEIASVPLVFLLLDPADLASPWVWVAGFALLRVFDMAKPPPVRWCERLPGGWGIMADDLAAAIAAGLALRLVLLAG